MIKPFDDSKFYRDAIIESGITPTELKKLEKVKKQKLKDKLGRFGKIDDKSILQLIAKELAVTLVPKSTTPIENKSDFEKYLDSRNNVRETCLYVIETLESKLDELIKNVEEIEISEKLKEAKDQSDQNRIDYLTNQEYDEDGQKYLNDDIAPTEFIHHDLLYVRKMLMEQLKISLFKEGEDWKQPKDWDALYNIDLGLFTEIPKLFKDIIGLAHLAFLRTGHRKHIDTMPTTSSFFQTQKTFENENSYVRYPTGRTPPYRAPTRGIPEDWVRDNAAPNEFLQCFLGTGQLIDAFRNFEAHKNDPLIKDRFDQAGRVIRDPLTNMLSPGNFIILANNSINLIYEVMEIIQIWIDSKNIQNKYI
jgi:hypothetical protein